MATTCSCDRCGKPDAMRLLASVATSGNIYIDRDKKMDLDLCHACARRAIDLIQKAFDEAQAAPSP